MQKRDLVSSLALLALAIATLIETITLEVGSLLSPQTGFFPFLLSIFLGILSLILLGQAIRGKGERKAPPWFSSGGWKSFGLTLGALFLFAVFFEWLGYLISTFLLISFLVGVIGKRKWWIVGLFGFLSTLVSYLIFGIFLKTQLPPGPWGGVN